MMMPALARDMAYRFQGHGAYIDRGYASLAADLRDIASVDPATLAAHAEVRNATILSAYGMMCSESGKPFAYADGVAIIPIHGTLLNRLNWSWSFATGYDFIHSQLRAALDDGDVRLIVFDINSPGGLAAGCPELSQAIFDSRETKPSLAVVDSRAFSAAFFLGSAATRMVCTPSGSVGSIGCVATHIDMSSALEKDGYKVTFIIEGDEKVDGNSYEPLSDRARASIQQDVSYHYGLFVEAVARNRGLSEDDVRATQARCYQPPDALELGLIDAVQVPAEAVIGFFDSPEDDGIMETTRSAPAATVATMNSSSPGAALSGTMLSTEPPALTMADVQRAATEAVAAERVRVSGIQGCEEATGRETLAAHLARNTSMSVDEARAILSASPKATAEAANTTQAPTGFAAAMNMTPNPNVGADTGGSGSEGEAGDPRVVGSRLLANYTAVTGVKFSRNAAA